MTGYWFESGILHMTGELPEAATMIDWHTDVDAGAIHAILTDTSPATHYADWDHYDDVTGELATGDGYTNDAAGGGKALANPAIAAITDTDRYIRYDADDLTWAAFSA